MAQLVGNLLVAQSGGPTAVINASVAGVIQEAGRHPDAIEEIYGGCNGIIGILNEKLIDILEEKSSAIEGLKHTPAAALGTCRYKLDFKKKPERAARDMDRLFQVFAHNIRYFFYAGGNDSQDTSHKIHEQAIARGYDLRVIGVPKTIDNDLPHTDSCPGYGSVIKFNSATVMEVGFDVASMATDDGSCCIIEVMGRSAGWIAAGTVLAKRGEPSAPPHIILLPEIQYDIDALLVKVKETVDAYKYCVIVVGEGIKNEKGEELGADKTRLDAFGHPVLAGAADKLKEIIQGKLNTKTRTVLLGYTQRAAAHFASLTDVQNAFACGETAVRAAVDGKSGYMVKNHPLGSAGRVDSMGHGPPALRGHRHRGTYDSARLDHPRRLSPRPAIRGLRLAPHPRRIDPADGGRSPKFVTLQKTMVEKKLPPYV